MIKSNRCTPKVAILGAGISGLTTAYYFKKKFPHIDFHIIEKNKKVGGVLDTLIHNGHLYELGARGIRPYGKGKVALEFIKEIGLWDKKVLANNRGKSRYIFINNKFEKFPDNLRSLLFSNATRGISAAILKDLFSKSHKSFDSDETVATFVERHFGKKLKDRLFDPIISGIYAGDVDRLGLNAAFPKLAAMEKKHGSLLKAWWIQKANAKKELGPLRDAAIVSFEKGMAQLAIELGSQLYGHLHLGQAVKSVTLMGNKYQVEFGQKCEQYDFVISTLPTYALSKVMHGFSKELPHYLDSIEYAPIAVVPLSFKNQVNFRNGFGYLIPFKEKQDILGVYCNDKAFPMFHKGRGSSFTVLIGGTRFKNFNDYSEKEFIAKAIANLKNHLHVKEDPIFSTCKIMPQALPQYNVGHLDTLRKIDSHCPGGLYVRGNFRDGVGISDIIKNSSDTVNVLKAQIENFQLTSVSTKLEESLPF